MSQKMRNIGVAFAISSFIAIVCVQTYLTPKNADECILSNIENANSDMAAKAVVHSCNNLYSK
ncbi:hypothetical protein CWB59_12640 [Pseudoalteromonas sp. S326]|nr:hypothetical protein CWB59_12640 [Pseudoalteromonas sp. S326]